LKPPAFAAKDAAMLSLEDIRPTGIAARLAGIVAVLALMLAGAGAAVAQEASRAAPEAATGLVPKPLARAKKHMVVAAHPLAAEAGREVLRQGGSAVDAAISVQLVLNLVEPQSSGIGGGGFMLYWDAKAKKLTSYDGRETAPAAAREDLFLDAGGKPLDFRDAISSGRSVGVPGILRMLEMAHREHGRLPWAKLFEPALKHAEGGFAVSPRLNMLLKWLGPDRFDETARAYFFDAMGTPRPAGYVLNNPALAKTFRTIADGGAGAFYRGAIARAIVERVRTAPRLPGAMSVQDLAAYKAKTRPPVCVPYRGYSVCGMGPPSSGGLAHHRAGTPPGIAGLRPGADGSRERPGTSHISIVDDGGNALALTTTIESAFGSQLMVDGFLLNNQLTDFSFRPRDATGTPVANRVEGGKRPRSSMSPTIVFDGEGRVWAVLGSPGGSRIILYVVKDLIALIDWHQDAQAAAALVNFGARGDTFEVETGVQGAAVAARMALKSHKVRPGMMNSGTHIVTRHGGVLEGGVDPRREGAALGD